MKVHEKDGAKHFSTEDIKVEAKLLDMRKLHLVDEFGQTVIPVLHPKTPHFRVLGGKSARELEAVSDRESHKDAIDYLVKWLNDSHLDEFRFTTYVFQGQGDSPTSEEEAALKGDGETSSWEEQVILAIKTPSEYVWFEESKARIPFDDNRYIQPDIAGMPNGQLRPTWSSPGIIIEVIRTHWPEEKTFERLRRLSKCAYLVIFWFIPEKNVESQLNRFWKDASTGKFRCAAYLFDGKLFVNGFEVGLSNKSNFDRHGSAVLRVFDPFQKRARPPRGQRS